MRRVRIHDLSLTTVVEYRRPVLFSDAKIESTIRALLDSKCAPYLNALDISTEKHNEFFSYKLTVPMFNGSASLVSNAQGITLSFKQGRTKEHLELMMNLTSAALEVSKVQEVKTTSISFNAHGVFDPTSSYPEHMVRYTSLRKDVTSGGIVLVMGVPELGGDFRYASEKSLVYQDGLFFVANAVLQQDFSPKVFEILAAKFEAAAALEEIEFPKT